MNLLNLTSTVSLVLHGGISYDIGVVTCNLCGGSSIVFDQCSQSTIGPIITWMGDCSLAGRPSGYIASHPDWLGLQCIEVMCGWPLWMVKWYQLLGWVNGDGGCSFLAAYSRACGSSLSAWFNRRQLPGAVLHSSHEMDELLQWLLSHDVSTINTVLVIITIITIIIMIRQQHAQY